MSPFFFFVQLLNAVQYALILYLVASGLTLLLGIMGVINLAHGAFYMVGAYIAFAVVQHFGELLAGAAGRHRDRAAARRVDREVSAVAARRRGSSVAGVAELRPDPADQRRPAHHLRQRSARRRGAEEPRATRSRSATRCPIRSIACSSALSASLFVVAIGLVMAKTRIGMMLRASAENRDMARALGVDAKRRLSRRHRGRHRLHGAGRRHRRAAGVGLSRHGRSGADPVVRHHRARRHRLAAAARWSGSLLLGLVDAFGKQFFPELRGIPGLCRDDRGADRAPAGPGAEHRHMNARLETLDAGLLMLLAVLRRSACRSCCRATRSSSRRRSRSRSGLAVALGLVVGPAGLTSVGHARVLRRCRLYAGDDGAEIRAGRSAVDGAVAIVARGRLRRDRRRGLDPLARHVLHPDDAGVRPARLSFLPRHRRSAAARTAPTSHFRPELHLPGQDVSFDSAASFYRLVRSSWSSSLSLTAGGCGARPSAASSSPRATTSSAPAPSAIRPMRCG